MNNYKNRFTKSGVTLLSLVITVIILIILAGVTINITIGEQGIFKHGQEAKVKQEIAEYLDNIELARGEVTIDKLGRVTLDDIIKKIEDNNIIPGGKIEKLDEEKAEVITKEGYVIIVTLKETKYDRLETQQRIPELQEGDIVISQPTWNASTNKASVDISKGSNISERLEIQYQVNDDKENGWSIGTKVEELNHGDVVNARLWNGASGGSYTSLTVVDSKNPQEAEIKFNSTSIKVGESTNASVKLTDNESGINISECRWSFVDSIDDIGTDASEYANEFEQTTNEQTISVSSENAGTYYLHVLSVDKAGNKIEKVSEPVEIANLYVGEKLKVGDYVRYEVASQSYTVETGKSGAAQQNFNTNTYTGLWRVLYNDSTNGLQLVSEDPVIDLTIKGKDGYNNLVSTLNTVASKYINTTYASEARALGSNVTTPEGTSAIYSNSEYSYVQTLANDMIVADTNYTADYNVMLSNNMANIGKEYWMASRYIYTDENGAGFNAVVTDKQGEIISLTLRCAHAIGTTGDHEYTKGVRVVVTLKPEVLVTTGNGKAENPYNIEVE